jgi:hypothetical protein
MDRVVAYIDGFNLYFGLKAAHGRKYLWLDLQALVESLLLPNQELREVQYFTARVRDDPNGERRQAVYLDALASHCQKVSGSMAGFRRKLAVARTAALVGPVMKRRRPTSTSLSL